MRKSWVWGAATALVLAASPAWAQLKIGYVNYPQLLAKSPQAQALSAKLKAEFQPRQQTLIRLQNQLKARADQFQRDAATMTDDQRQQTQNALAESDRDLQRRQQDFQDAVTAQRNEALATLQRTLVQTVQEYARAQNYDLVLADGVIYAKNGIDITPQILARLQAAARSGGGAVRRATPRK